MILLELVSPYFYFNVNDYDLIPDGVSIGVAIDFKTFGFNIQELRGSLNSNPNIRYFHSKTAGRGLFFCLFEKSNSSDLKLLLRRLDCFF